MPFRRQDSGQHDKMYQMYMQAPYKLMDKKREQRQARLNQNKKYDFLNSIPNGPGLGHQSNVFNNQRSSMQRTNNNDSQDRLSAFEGY